MATRTLAPPTAEALGLQFGHLWKLCRAARAQNDEVNALNKDIAALADNAIKAIRDNRPGEAIHALVGIKEKSAALAVVEARDVSIESTLREMLHHMKTALSRLFSR